MMKKNRTRILFIPRYLYPVFEKKLTRMSAKGWHLIKYWHLIYRFEKGEPCSKTYFMCLLTGGIRNDDGFFSIGLRHPFFEKKYSVKKSKLNKYSRAKNINPILFEVDKSKIDIGFYELKKDRNKLGYLELLRESILLAVSLTVLFFLSAKPITKIVLLLLLAVITLNLIVGLLFTVINSKSSSDS